MESRVMFTIYRNLKKPGEGKNISIERSASFSQLLQRCSEKLGVKAKRIFRSTGEELTDVKMINEDDVLYVSEGDGFALGDSLNTLSGRPGPSPSVYHNNNLIRQTVMANPSLPNAMHRCRIAVIGPAAVGKSALTIQYTKKYFVEDYINTIEDEHKTLVNVDGQLCEVVILDTAGLEDFIALRMNWITNSEAILMVFSVDKHSYLEEMDNFYRIYCVSNPEKSKPLALVCNKIDLENREISTEEGQALAAKYNAKYFETSAKLNYKVEDVFNNLVKQLVAQKSKNRSRQQDEPEKSFWSWCSMI